MDAASPELPGSVCAQYRRRGDKLYGPYWFRFWREDGKLRKVYVRKDELEAIRALCHNRHIRHSERRNSASNLRTLRARTLTPLQKVAQCKETFAVLALLERKEDHELTELQRQRIARLLANMKAKRT